MNVKDSSGINHDVCVAAGVGQGRRRLYIHSGTAAGELDREDSGGQWSTARIQVERTLTEDFLSGVGESSQFHWLVWRP